MVEKTGDVREQFLVARLGADIVGIEAIESGNKIWKAKVLLRSPTVSYTTFELKLNDALELENFRAREFAIQGETITDKVLGEKQMYFEGDSLVIEYNTIRSRDKVKIMADKTALPFLELVHWPYGVLLDRLHQNGDADIVQPMIIRKRQLDFKVNRVEPQIVEIIHPRQGLIKVKMSEERKLDEIDASATTRKLFVESTSKIDFKEYLKDFLEREGHGETMIALSGRGKEEAYIEPANIIVDYGQPSKRGRKLFGDLVPWGTVWRTGANLAPHFITDKDLLFGDSLLVKAGAYTLFTQPERDGGVLIFNKNTGINGKDYRSEDDLGRVSMQIGKQDNVEEQLLIRIQPVLSGGLLELVWGNTIFSVPFEVVNSPTF